MTIQRCSQRTLCSWLTCVVLLSGLIALPGCTKEALEPINTVEWYKAHEAEMTAMVKKCHSNPGQLASTPNCVNAQQAMSLTVRGL